MTHLVIHEVDPVYNILHLRVHRYGTEDGHRHLGQQANHADMYH